MLTQAQPQTNYKTDPKKKIVDYGDFLASQVVNVLTAQCGKRNQDETFYSPRVKSVVADVFVTPPFYYVALDDNALFHFPRNTFIGERTRDALSGVLHLPVFVFLPEQCTELREALAAKGATLTYGVTYAIALQPLKLLRQSVAPEVVRLPRTAQLDSVTIARNRLQVPIGITAGDQPLVKTLPQMGHTIIVGTTGSGKSMFLHAAISTLLQYNEPDQLKILLLDPKRSEFFMYRQAPSVIAVCENAEQYDIQLQAAVVEMDTRGALMQQQMCRDIQAYNAKVSLDKRLPYLLVVIDETIELLAAESSKLNRLIQAIASRGRSAGIILFAATQHASLVSGLPRVVNVNLSTRVVLRVADESAARSAGCPGAQDLPKVPGRMLVKMDSTAILAQGYAVDIEATIRRFGAGGVAHSDTTRPHISPGDLALVRWAHEENDDELTIDAIKSRLSLSDRQARAFSDRLTLGRWIAKAPPYNRKRLTPAALELLANDSSFRSNDTNAANVRLTDSSPADPIHVKRDNRDKRYPEQLSDLWNSQDAELLAKIEPRLAELTQQGISAQEAYEQIVAEL